MVMMMAKKSTRSRPLLLLKKARHALAVERLIIRRLEKRNDCHQQEKQSFRGSPRTLSGRAHRQVGHPRGMGLVKKGRLLRTNVFRWAPPRRILLAARTQGQ